MIQCKFDIRMLSADDSLDELTRLLHRSYKQLKDRGYHSLATHQSVEITAQRVANGMCFVALSDTHIIGTITYISAKNSGNHVWYAQDNVGVCSQFGVLPEFQRMGIGSALLTTAENAALDEGATEIALDTISEATDLVDYYLRKGFRKVGEAQWEAVNYRSVILSKQLL